MVQCPHLGAAAGEWGGEQAKAVVAVAAETAADVAAAEKKEATAVAVATGQSTGQDRPGAQKREGFTGTKRRSMLPAHVENLS